MLKISLLFKNFTNFTGNSGILRIKNAKFSGCCFYMNTNMWGDFQISISVPLKLVFLKNNSVYNYNFVIYIVFSVLVSKFYAKDNTKSICYSRSLD